VTSVNAEVIRFPRQRQDSPAYSLGFRDGRHFHWTRARRLRRREHEPRAPRRPSRRVRASTLAEYYEILKAHATKGGTLDLLEAEFATFRAGYRRASMAFLAPNRAASAPSSPGPSNFPVRRAEKRNDVAHKRLGELVEYPQIALKRAMRVLRPDLRPIMAGDGNAVERLEAELEKAERCSSPHEGRERGDPAQREGRPEAQLGALVFLGYRERSREAA
jgi:hypothetical protein